MKFLKKLKSRKMPNLLQDLLLWILFATTSMLLAMIVFNAVHLVNYVRALRVDDYGRAAQELGPLPLVWSVVSMVLFVLVGWGFWFVFRRRQVEQLRLRRSEQKYRNIINNAGEAIFLLDHQGKVIEWNKTAETLFGHPRRNVLNRQFCDVHVCYGSKVERAIADADRRGDRVSFEMPLRGRELTLDSGMLSMSVSPITVGRAKGGSDGTKRSYVVIARDITSERQLETRMSETEKLASLGQLAAGVAHQLNTPLGSILLSAQMLEETNESDDDAEDLQRIVRQTVQCRTIIKGLLNFARASGSERSPQNLADIVQETIFLMEKNIKLAGVEVAIEDRGEVVIHGNRNELEQVFFNLLSNSLDAMKDGGKISIIMDRLDDGEGRVVFADTGPGIPEKEREKVFLPFFTTKEYGKGTGLGLAIVARIVHEHGGHVLLVNDNQSGARFEITFPLLRESTHTEAIS